MKPDSFQKAQKLFLDAIAVPVEERSEFIRKNADSVEVRDEVLSLLRFHDNETLLPQTTTSITSIPRAPDPTVEFDGGQVPSPGPRDQSPSVLGLLDIEPSSNVSERFAQSTNQLLRNRLIAATVVLSGMSVFVTIVAALFNEIVVARLAVRAVTLSLLSACFWYLKNHFNLSRLWLRTLELFVIAIPLVELTLIQWFESTKLLAEGEAVQIEELRAIAFTVVSIYIAVYGMFIPSNWRRTAFITCSIALVPTLVSVLHQMTHTYPPEVEWMHFANPTLVAVMAVVATVGAGIVHRVRREAESARYYGQYELIEEIGRGGMGVVYLGRHQMLKRPAAIKLIHSESAGSPQAIAQFEKEVQATATLSHWNTVQIYDYGTTEEGDFYCVMEYLKGATLQQRLNQIDTLETDATFDIVVQLCDGLEEAHLKGMVHRDIKPANIFLAQIGGFPDVVKLLDFGLVVTKEETEGEERPLVGGTPAYMSPEQIRGEALDGRSDIYAIGCVMFECLTGFPPFQGYPISAIISGHLFKVPAYDRLSGIDAALPGLLEKCLAKDREKRFANVAELREACRKWQ